MRSPHVPTLVALASLACLAAGSFPARADLAADIGRQLASSEPSVRVATLRSMPGSGLGKKEAAPLLDRLVDDPSDRVRIELVWTVESVLGDRGVAILSRLTDDRVRAVRLSAIRAVCRMWAERSARERCSSEFHTGDDVVRVEVIQTLRQSHPSDRAAAELFRRGLESDSAVVLRAAVFGTQAARDPLAVSALYEVARTAPDVAAVPAAEEALATIADDAAIEALIGLLPRPAGTENQKGWPSPAVRAAAARALARLRAEPARAQLRALLKDGDVELVLAALDGLLQMRDALSVGAISRLLEHEDARVRRGALRVLRQFGDDSCSDKVRASLSQDRSAEVRAAAVTTLVGLVGSAAIPDIRALSADPDARVRLDAVGALAGLGPPAAEALARFLGDDDIDVHSLAVRGLAQTGDRKAFPLLAKNVPFGDAADVRLRFEYARTLGIVRDPRAIPLLAKYAEDTDPRVRERSAMSLAQTGDAAAAPALRELAKDPIDRVAAAARRALASLPSR